MLQRLVVVLTAAMLLLLLTSCSKSINLKAGIVYRIGGAQPVARTTFYLTRDDLLTLMRQAGMNYAHNMDVVGREAEFHQRVGEQISDVELAVRSRAISIATTDFEGNAKFENVPTGSYYIIGITQTRSGIALWNLQVNAGDSVILDQNNAAFISNQ